MKVTNTFRNFKKKLIASKCNIIVHIPGNVRCKNGDYRVICNKFRKPAFHSNYK